MRDEDMHVVPQIDRAGILRILLGWHGRHIYVCSPPICLRQHANECVVDAEGAYLVARPYRSTYPWCITVNTLPLGRSTSTRRGLSRLLSFGNDTMPSTAISNSSVGNDSKDGSGDGGGDGVNRGEKEFRRDGRALLVGEASSSSSSDPEVEVEEEGWRSSSEEIRMTSPLGAG